jgi:hypothetical protein
MKIGILTYHSVYNFGANLQVYSTVGYLKNNGFEPVVINWIPEDLEARYDRTIPPVQAGSHKEFIKTFLPCTRICRINTDIAQVVKEENINGIIVGSDAVLQHTPFLSRLHLTKKGIILGKKPESDRLFPNAFWGSFIPFLEEKIPIIIISASSQNTNFKYIRGKSRKRMKLSLNQFKYITVRDDWTSRMIKYLSNGTIIPDITPDPVFAYNQNIKEQYSKEEILKKFNLHDNYLLVSFRSQNCVTRDWLKSFNEIAERNSLSCVALPMPNGIIFDNPFSSSIELPLGPIEWYSLIRYSSGYIGENMHPIIVALHNEVPFYSFDTYGIILLRFFVNEKSSKIYDILSKAGFTKNRICALGKGYKCPTPGEVFSRINDFDFLKSHLFRINQQNCYNLMMKRITSLF